MNEVVAFGPEGTVVWQRTLGTPRPMPNPAEGADCGDINPLGVTGTPVIDLGRDTLYLDAMVSEEGSAHLRIFALSLADGSTRAGWPVDVGTTVAAEIPFLPAVENQRGERTIFDRVIFGRRDRDDGRLALHATFGHRGLELQVRGEFLDRRGLVRRALLQPLEHERS
jgi:hypothetical protein